MIPVTSRYAFLSMMFILFMVCLSITSWAEEPCENWVGKIVSTQGSVEAQRVGETHWGPVRLNDTYCIGDMIRVQKNSRAALILVNGATLRLDQKTTITFSPPEEKETLLLRLLKGSAHFFSRDPHSLKLYTPFVNAAVEGTEFFVRVDENRTYISIFDGMVVASNNAGSLILASGQTAITEAGKAPVAQVVARPRDAVNWALYYPSVIYGEAPAGEDTSDPRFLVHQASKLLSVGRVDQAKSNIEQALKKEPKYGDAIALQSIIAVVQNEKDKALDRARQAVETDPKSAAARIALSYAQQASFDLEGARASLEEAVKLEPENALAWARLAELWSSFGDLDKALNAARRAAALDPNLSRTQSVLGFAYLTQIKTRESKEAFEKAIELDQAAPLPRLGLGLAKIRDGDLQDGGREIEIAASLDPNNSLIRSYLGKVYYEEKRVKLDGREYAVAKELDPKDPTPWFYDAIRKQTINRPVEALQDLQRSIELNDNRAVYRSRLLLDQDLAARSSSLARIYNDLGFEQLGLVEGWKSVNTDPTDFSAHRFLADAYAALPNHEIARMSELLQSQLLQPINITPIQPQLTEFNFSQLIQPQLAANNPQLLESAGQSNPSFNEFNPLFQRNRLSLQTSGLVGGNSTHGDDLVFSGVYGRTSFSIGQSHYETDGFRENNDQDVDIYNLFVQESLSHKTSIQAEYRNTNKERGDLGRLLDPDNFLTNLRQEQDAESFRFGFHHAFSPNSDFIVSFIYQDAAFNVKDIFPFGPPMEVSVQLEANIDGYTSEAQYQLRHDRFNIIMGAGNFDAELETIETFDFIIPGIPPMPGERAESQTDIRHTNFYVYSQIKYPEKFIWTLGASADHLDEWAYDLDTDQFNPKFGMSWNPLQNTTLRAAAFRVFTRTLISNQTIEPTQVAGFNQFFDDPGATDSWLYGIAIDQKFSKKLYGGVEYSKRDMEVPFPSVQTLQADWEEQFSRAYLYWAPFKLLSATVEYQYERLERDHEFPDIEENIVDLKTHRLPLSIRLFHPSGISAGLTTTYIDQNGVFWDSSLTAPSTIKDSDNYWVMDASISYRLPHRLGLITIVGKNLLDQKFRIQDIGYPERVVYAKFTLAF